MKTSFLKKFEKDLDKIDTQFILDDISSVIEQIEAAQDLQEIPNVKKLIGFKNAYRIRIGNFRIGIYLIDNEEVEFVRVVHRKEIYKVFP